MTTNAGRAPPIPAGVGSDGASFRGLDAAGAPVTVLRLMPADEAIVSARRRRLIPLLENSVDGALAVRRVDVKAGVVVLERPPRSLAEALEAAPFTTELALRYAHDLAAQLLLAHQRGLALGGFDSTSVWLREDGSAALDLTGLRCITVDDPLARACRSRFAGAALEPRDAWSLGVLLSAMLEGVSHAVTRAEQPAPTSTSALTKQVDGPIAQLTNELLELEPGWRPRFDEIERRIAKLRGADVPDAHVTNVDDGTQGDVDEWPKQLGRFKVIDLLGEGAMGRVFRAEDLSTGEHVAVKVAGVGAPPSRRALKRFRKEARILAELRNPGVAALIDAGEDDGYPWMAVELVRGETLADLIKTKAPLPEKDALKIVTEIAAALVDVHDAGVVHRDLKPDNILMSDGGIKLIDFGIARHLDEDGSLAMTRQGAVLGTPLYMSPEQAQGATVDARSDIYALGTLLFELLVGKPPFYGQGAALVIAMQISERPPRAMDMRADVSREVSTLIEKCLEKAPASRFQNAREMLGELRALMHEHVAGIAQHPRKETSSSTMRWAFEWSLKGSPGELWPFVANTDRLNRAIGLGAVEEVIRVVDDDAQIFGKTRQAGFALEWREHPYEWVLERRIGVLREYLEGPLRSLRSSVDLLAEGTGTRLVHTIEIEPRGMLGRAAATVEIGVKTKRALERVYKRIDDLVAGKLGDSGLIDAFETPESLPREREERLAQIERASVSAGAEPAVIARLGDFIRAAPAMDLSRIRPLALARRLSLDEEQTLRGCLIAAHEGMLVPLWDLLCPSCRAPSEFEETLRALKTHGRCDACNLDFNVDLATSIELVFRVHPQIRAADSETYCLSSPGKSPHVAAQVRLAAGEKFLLEMRLPESTYQLVGRHLPYQITFRTADGAPTSRWDLDLSAGPRPGLGRILSTSRIELELTNDTNREQLVRIERATPRDDVLTAARAAAHPLFRKLFPQEVLQPGALVKVSCVTLLYAELRGESASSAAEGDPNGFAALYEAYKAVEAEVGRLGGSAVKIVGDGVLAVFDDAGHAVECALALPAAVRKVSPKTSVRTGVHRGPAAAVTLNERLDYFGKGVRQALELAVSADDGGLAVGDEALGDPVVQKILDERAKLGGLAAKTITREPQLISA